MSESNETTWPEYDAPEGVGGVEPSAPTAPPEAEPVQPPPAVTGSAAGPPTAAGSTAHLPPYRQEQIAERDRKASEASESERINALVTEGIRKMLGQAIGLTPGSPPEDPRQARLRDTIYGLIPGLKELIEKKQELADLMTAAPGMREATQAHWNGVADRAKTALHTGIAHLILGESKTGADLDPEMADDVRDAFIRWVEGDRTGQRVARYESGQETQVVQEYLRTFAARYLDPVRRTAAVAVVRRGEDRARQPQTGSSALPPAAKPPKPDLSNEDEVHGRGWAVMEQLRGV